MLFFGIRASFKDLSMILPSSIFVGNNFCHLPIASSPLANENSYRLKKCLNPFSTNVSLTDKPGNWFLLAKCLKNTCGRVTF